MPDIDMEVPPAPAPTPSPEERRRQMLDELGLMTEDDYALLLGVTKKTLKNKPLSDLPEHVMHGRETFYLKKSVTLHMRQGKPKRRRVKAR